MQTCQMRNQRNEQRCERQDECGRTPRNERSEKHAKHDKRRNKDKKRLKHSYKRTSYHGVLSCRVVHVSTHGQAEHGVRSVRTSTCEAVRRSANLTEQSRGSVPAPERTTARTRFHSHLREPTHWGSRVQAGHEFLQPRPQFVVAVRAGAQACMTPAGSAGRSVRVPEPDQQQQQQQQPPTLGKLPHRQ